MLTQMRLLDRRTYIPIKLVEVMPREAKRLQKIETQKRNKARRERNELLKALQIPLISEELWKTFTEDRTSVEEAMATVGPDAIGVGPEIDEPVVWAHDEIVVLHAVLLEESLKALTAKGNPSEKMDILEWMFEPDFVAEVVLQTPQGPRKKVIYNDQVPFSFAFCCKLQGHDPAKYRAYMRQVIPDVAKRFMHMDGEDFPTLQEVLTPFRTPF